MSLENLSYTPSDLIDSTRQHSNSDNQVFLNGYSTNHHSMTNGYNSTTKSRSCENNLDSFGRKDVSEDLTMSSSSLIDLPPPSVTTSTNDYDNLDGLKTNEEILEDLTHMNQPSTRTTGQIQSPMSSELDQKIKEEIDAKLKHIDDDLDSNGNFRWIKIIFIYFLSFPGIVTAETVNKSVDSPSARRLAKRLYALDGFKSTDVVFHLCKRYLQKTNEEIFHPVNLFRLKKGNLF